jgi:hypothetical protein
MPRPKHSEAYRARRRQRRNRKVWGPRPYLSRWFDRCYSCFGRIPRGGICVANDCLPF